MGSDRVYAKVTVSWVADTAGVPVSRVRADVRIGLLDMEDGFAVARYIIGAKVCQRRRSKR